VSVAGEILAAAGRLAAGLTLSPAPSAVVARKRRALLDGDNLTVGPVVVLACQEHGEAERQTAGGVYQVRYQAGVAVAMTSGGRAGDNAALREWLDLLKGAFWRAEGWRAAGLDVDDVLPRSAMVFEEQAAKLQVDWGVLTLTVQTREQR